MSDQVGRHILHRYDEELIALHTLISRMGELVLSQLGQSLEAIKKSNPTLAEQVIQRERDINQLEVTADNEIFRILARRNPVAGDLRFVIAAAKIINDLERIGDEAAKLARFALSWQAADHHAPVTCLLDEVCLVGDLALTALQHALQAVAEMDVAKAQEIAHDHRTLDHQFNVSLNRVMSRPFPNAHKVGHSVQVVLMLKALERVGDHAQNLAEYVIFQMVGEDVRHRLPDYDQGYPPVSPGDEPEPTQS